jgi:hypothetical protein
MEQIIKKVIICILISWIITLPKIYSQCWNNGFYNRPAKETSGGRYREPNYVASQPYTLFEKRKTGWTLGNNITEKVYFRYLLNA